MPSSYDPYYIPKRWGEFKYADQKFFGWAGYCGYRGGGEPLNSQILRIFNPKALAIDLVVKLQALLPGRQAGVNDAGHQVALVIEGQTDKGRWRGAGDGRAARRCQNLKG